MIIYRRVLKVILNRRRYKTYLLQIKKYKTYLLQKEEYFINIFCIKQRCTKSRPFNPFCICRQLDTLCLISTITIIVMIYYDITIIILIIFSNSAPARVGIRL